MKDSKIEWVGEIPDNWEVKPIRNIILERDGGIWGRDPQNDEEGTICMRIADFDFSKGLFKTINLEKLTKRKYSYTQILKYQLKKGDLLIEKSGGG